MSSHPCRCQNVWICNWVSNFEFQVLTDTTIAKVSLPPQVEKCFKKMRKNTKTSENLQFRVSNDDRRVLTDTTIAKVWLPPTTGTTEPQASIGVKMWPKIFSQNVTKNICLKFDLKYFPKMWPKIFSQNVTLNICSKWDLKYLLWSEASHSSPLNKTWWPFMPDLKPKLKLN